MEMDIEIWDFIHVTNQLFSPIFSIKSHPFSALFSHSLSLMDINPFNFLYNFRTKNHFNKSNLSWSIFQFSTIKSIHWISNKSDLKLNEKFSFYWKNNFFRSKIVYFEHFSSFIQLFSLISVENIEQFDATRLFLKELDIPDFVWIGLMRPSNTDQFSWT